MSLDCVIGGDSLIYERRLLILALTFIPAAVFISSVFSVLHWRLVKKTLPRRGELLPALLPAAIIVCFVYHPIVTDVFFQTAIDCTQFGDSLRLTSNMNVVCFEGEHWELLQLAIIGILLYSLGIPLLFATLLWTHRQHLLEATTRNLLGFLFSGYTRHAYYYECVLMLR